MDTGDNQVARREGWIPGSEPLTPAERQARRYLKTDKESHRDRIAVGRIERNSLREFIAWDGEGVNTRGPGKPQAYVLFGSSTGDYITRRDSESLNSIDCFELILNVGRQNPTAWHVAFAFDYDINEIVRCLPYLRLEQLKDTGVTRYGPYRISWRRGKTFTVSKAVDGVSESVTIFDVFSFFASSFVKALSAILGDDPRYRDAVRKVREGKAERKFFTLEELDSVILPYWQEEIVLLATLVSRFRDLLYGAGFHITKWYGPGAIASFVLKRESLNAHMASTPDEVNKAAQYAYAGGRFEHFRVGRIVGPIWAIDINSAYPDAIARLPSLTGGHWHYQPIGKPASEIPRDDIESFAIYNVKLDHPRYRLPWYPNTPPSPLFFRSPDGEMRYPWNVKGWYWGPEVENLCHPAIAPYAYVYGAWVFHPGDGKDQPLPFTFIPGMYSLRKEWKRAGKPEQLALKLAMNSIYGKLAQRVGWEKSHGAPRFHQLEWAGWITSYVRARLFRALWGLGDGIIAVETDGIYTARDPATIGIESSDRLGEWDIRQYDEIIYLQSGTYFARNGEQWISKYRGLDPDSLSIKDALHYLRSIENNGGYALPELRGTTTRFIGLNAAIHRANGNPHKFRNLHCVWTQDAERDISPGKGKRNHHPDSCVECSKGISPYDYGHYMTVGLTLPPNGVNESTKHYLPWVDGADKDDETRWRAAKEVESDYLHE